MTQDELDSLVGSDIDQEVVLGNDQTEEIIDDHYVDNRPPPATKEHKIVNQLDDVTRDSEVKANEIFDKLDEINEHLEELNSEIDIIQDVFGDNVLLFEKLTNKFPNIESFSTALEQNQNALQKCENVNEQAENSSDDIIMIMDIMQYQDIHRQKIERVINVMRALSNYMNSLFESDTDDSKRVTSAQHLDGDSTEIVDDDEIEALLANFGK